MNEIKSTTIFSKYKDEVEQILAKYPAAFKRSAVMPLLYIAQREQGYVTRQAMAEIAGLLGLSTTDVASVTGFYSLYYDAPHGRYHIQVCTDLPCAMRGAEQFLKDLCGYLGVGVGETTPDGLFTVESVKCLAACHRAPMFQVQEGDVLMYHENQTLATARAWIEEVRSNGVNSVGNTVGGGGGVASSSGGNTVGGSGNGAKP